MKVAIAGVERSDRIVWRRDERDFVPGDRQCLFSCLGDVVDHFEPLGSDTGSQGQVVSRLKQNADRRSFAGKCVAGENGDVCDDRRPQDLGQCRFV